MIRRVLLNAQELKPILEGETKITLSKRAWRWHLMETSQWQRFEKGDFLWVGENYHVTGIDPARGFYDADCQAWIIHYPQAAVLKTPPYRNAQGKVFGRPLFAMPKELSRFTLEVSKSEIKGDVVRLSCLIHRANVKEVSR